MKILNRMKLRGASALGYGLVVGLIGVTSLVAIGQSGSAVTCLFDMTASKLGDNPGGIIGCGGSLTDFDFVDLTGQEPATSLVSNTVTLDMSGSAVFTVAGATLIRNGQDGGQTSVQFDPGDTIALRMSSSTGWDSTATGVISVGREQVDWAITTREQDTAITLAGGFDPVGGAEPSTPQTSTPITVSDFDPGGVVAEAPSGAILIINGTPVGSGPVELSPGDQIEVEADSGAGFEDVVSLPITIGDQTVTWVITTRGNDLSPAGAGSLGSDTDIQPSSSQTSEIVTLSDFDGTLSISATNGATVEVNSGSGFATASTAQAGDQVRLVMTANSGLNSTRTSTFTIGDYTSPTYTVRTWYYTTGSATGYGSCSGPCSSTGSQSPTGWTCNRSDGTTGHSQSFCSSPGSISCSTSSCFTSTPPSTGGTGGSNTTVTFGGSQSIRITCSADGGQANYVDSLSVSTSSSSASVFLSQIRTPSSGRIGQASINFSVSGGNVYPTSITTGYNGKQYMCYSPSQGLCSQIPDYNCSSPIACRVWNLSTGQRWYFVRSGGNRGQSYVSGSDNIIQTTCVPNNWPSNTFRYCWQNGTC